jgi:glycosyltransferase involved in cell wall biosynthesis
MISFCNQTYNESQGIDRYLHSCLSFRDVIDQVHVVDHRSDDDTQHVLDSYQDQFKDAGIKLTTRLEDRDFSKDFLIADLFGDTVEDCDNEIVFRHDADFILGPGYVDLIDKCVNFLSREDVYAVGYEIPCVGDSLSINDNIVTSYGYCNLHSPVPRVFKKSKTVCKQDHFGGKYEFFYPTDSKCSQWIQMKYVKDSLISVNIKPQERMKQRETMNTYMKDVVDGVDHDDWMDCDQLKSEVEPQNRPSFHSFNIIGQRLLYNELILS